MREKEIVCVAHTSAGLFYGRQTLRQLIRANRYEDSIPCLLIRDWPSLRWRGFQDDLARGPSSTLDTLKFEADLGAFLKLNLMTYYTVARSRRYWIRNSPANVPPDSAA